MPEPPAPKVMRMKLWLQVENNKYVWRKSKSREEIERWVLDLYVVQPRPKDGGPYELAIPHETDEELDRTIYDLLAEAERTADPRHCFIEADCTSMDDPDRHW